MKMIKQVVFVVVISLFLSGCFGRVQPIYDAKTVPVPVTAQGLSDAKLADAIIAAGAKRDWIMEKVGPGQIRATLRPRTHVAVVDISYSNESFSMTYNSSQNLLHDGSRIHRNYNRWVKNLETDIVSSLYATAAASN